MKLISAAFLILIIPSSLLAQTRWRQICETPLSLQSRIGIDSNPLRLAQPSGKEHIEGLRAAAEEPGGDTGNTGETGQADVSAMLRPSIGLRCAVTPATTIWGSYALGLERFKSTRALNMTANIGEFRVTHRFGNRWSGGVFAGYERSRQPDVLGLSAPLSFATFQQERAGFRLTRRDDAGTMFAEYWAQPRRYDRLLPSTSTRQSDTLQSIALGRWWTSSAKSLLGLRFEYRKNQSNDPIFRYSEPILSLSYVRSLASGFRVEATPRLRWIAFGSRPVSTDPGRKRADVIPGFAITARREIRPGITAVASYAFDKDFSTEPLRRFNDHRISFGFDVAVGSHSHRAAYAGGEQDEHSLRAIQLANRGYTEITRGNWSEALRFSLEAIQFDALLPEAHTNAGIAYYKLGRVPEAIAEWKQSLALRPDAKVKSLLDKIAK